MEFVFFNCRELDKQPERIKKILSEDESVFEKSAKYFGIGNDCKHYRLREENIKNDDCVFSLKDYNKPIISKRWKRIKETRKIKRDTPQSEDLLYDMKILPLAGIYKSPNLQNSSLWNNREISNTKSCDYFALMIDPGKDKIVGVAKAFINKPGSDTYETPEGSDILPNTIEYVYISAVDIHPNYIGQGHCKPLVRFLMNKISEVRPNSTHFSIDNASFTEEGIPACVCYVKSGIENGYDVYYNYYGTDVVNKMTPELCYTSDKDTLYKMPIMYFYVKKKREGGKRRKKKRNTKRKSSINSKRKTKRKN